MRDGGNERLKDLSFCLSENLAGDSISLVLAHHLSTDGCHIARVSREELLVWPGCCLDRSISSVHGIELHMSMVYLGTFDDDTDSRDRESCLE